MVTRKNKNIKKNVFKLYLKIFSPPKKMFYRKSNIQKRSHAEFSRNFVGQKQKQLDILL